MIGSASQIGSEKLARRIRQNNKPAYLLISLISPILSLPYGFSVHKISNFEVLDERESRSGSFKIKEEFFFN